MSLGTAPLGTAALGTLAVSGIAGTDRLYLASRDYTTLPTDMPPHRYYRGAAKNPLRVTRSVIGGGTPVETIGISTGEIELLNGDGALDSYISSGSLDGREVIVSALRRSGPGDTVFFQQPFADARVLFKGIMAGVGYGLDRATVAVRSRDALLGSDVQSVLYQGTGGAEGGADLKDKPKPVALGTSFGVAPVYLGVIGGQHSFQVSGGAALPIADVPRFFDKGLALTQVGGTPSAGEYAVDTATGIVTIGGAAPAFPTCDVEGYAPGGVLLSRTGDLILSVLESFAQVPNVQIDVAALMALSGAQPAPVGLWIGDRAASVLTVIGALLRGITAWGGFDRLNRFTAGRLAAPGGVIRATFDAASIVGLAQIAGPEVMDPPAWRHEVEWQPSYTVSADLDINATPEQRAFMAQAARLAVAADAAILDKHLTSRPWRTPGLFAAQADAQDEAARLVALYRNRRLFRFQVFNIAPEIDIGQTVRVDYPRFNLSNRLATVLGLAVDTEARLAELDLFL
jgi:hypothetical protein